jgi:hypothetical protein
LICHRSAAAIAAALALLAPTGAAHAWGATGHRIIGRVGAASLPDNIPGFLRTDQAIKAIGELAREPDRWRAAGKTHDNFRDGGHFVDVDDEGKVLGGPSLSALPETRSDYETALRAVGTESAHAGWLPYSIIDGWQQLAKDFVYWRVLTADIPRETDPTRKAWLEADLQRREAQTIQDLGVWAHYVGDGGQPMHVSVHYNGWGAFPNPEGFTQDRVHLPFEGGFVRQWVTEAEVQAALPAPRACEAIQTCTEAYLAETAATVVPFYRMQKAGGLTGPAPAGKAFAVARIAAASAELRDMVVSAWEASAHGSLGYPPLTVDQVVKEKIDPWNALYGDD